MEKRLSADYQRLLALADSTEQATIREVCLFAVAADSEGDAVSRDAARVLLVTSAKSFTRLLSMTFQAVAWNKEVLYDARSFYGIYEKVFESTVGFSRVDQATVAAVLADNPPSLLVFRSIAALSLDELSLLLKETEGFEFSKDQMREFELGRKVGRADTQKWQGASGHLARIICDAIGGDLLELPQTAPKDLFKDRKDKTDTRDGWTSVRATAAHGVAYWELLYQRYVGGFFRQAMDASSSIKGDILEAAIVQLFTSHHVPFYQTRPREKIPSWEQAPDFLLPNRGEPTVALEAKLAEDGGTARDKAARVERFCNEARKKGVLPIAVIDGKGFYRLNDVTAPILKNTRGETYTLKTLQRLLVLPEIAALKGKD
jgi:hypothetical protein